MLQLWGWEDSPVGTMLSKPAKGPQLGSPAPTEKAGQQHVPAVLALQMWTRAVGQLFRERPCLKTRWEPTVVVHTSDPSTQETERVSLSLSLKLSWSTE